LRRRAFAFSVLFFLLADAARACAYRLRWRSAPPLRGADAARALADVAAALAYCHRQGVSHGDVKPENMLRGADGRVRLTDFSVSQARIAAH
jgi:serine/threonine protein kinase